MKGCRAPNAISPVARPGSPFIALDTLISSGFDSSPWARVRFPTCAEKILNLNGPRSENRQWGDISPNASGDEWKNNWEELYFPINVHDNHWILILVDKPAKAVVVFDSIAYFNQYQVNKIFDLVKMMEDSTTAWSTIDNSENHDIQRQTDRVNCGYFTCWYAWQLPMNESTDKFDGKYEAVIKDIREDIMCLSCSSEIQGFRKHSKNFYINLSLQKTRLSFEK